MEQAAVTVITTGSVPDPELSSPAETPAETVTAELARGALEATATAAEATAAAATATEAAQEAKETTEQAGSSIQFLLSEVSELRRMVTALQPETVSETEAETETEIAGVVAVAVPQEAATDDQAPAPTTARKSWVRRALLG